MVAQEAFDKLAPYILQQQSDYLCRLGSGEARDLDFESILSAMFFALYAIETKIPKCPDMFPKDDDCSYSSYMCPACEGRLTYGDPEPLEKPPHCYCGQAIDWSEYEN